MSSSSLPAVLRSHSSPLGVSTKTPSQIKYVTLDVCIRNEVDGHRRPLKQICGFKLPFESEFARFFSELIRGCQQP